MKAPAYSSTSSSVATRTSGSVTRTSTPPPPAPPGPRGADPPPPPPPFAPHKIVVPRLDTDHAHVLDRGFGAVARAAGDGELALVRRPGAPAHLLQLDAQAGRILSAE